jgi:hypothetical protein
MYVYIFTIWSNNDCQEDINNNNSSNSGSQKTTRKSVSILSRAKKVVMMTINKHYVVNLQFYFAGSWNRKRSH